MDSIASIIDKNKVVGETNGITIVRILCHHEDPSILLTSYKSCGIFCSASEQNNIAQPEFFHTVTIIIDHKALSELCNQSGCGKWNQPNIWFNKPTSGSYIQAHTIDIATIGVIQGEN